MALGVSCCVGFTMAREKFKREIEIRRECCMGRGVIHIYCPHGLGPLNGFKSKGFGFLNPPSSHSQTQFEICWIHLGFG